MIPELPPHPPSFFDSVWEIVKQVPPGKVTTFGQISSMMPTPEGVDPELFRRIGARWVGKAMNAARIEDEIPWQRVINSQGKIALPEESNGANIQRTRLEEEGVEFDSRDRVNFNVVGWEGPDENWRLERGLNPPRPLAVESERTGDGPQQLSLF